MTVQATPSTRERKKSATRERIQAAALQLCQGRGYEEVTVEDIARAAGVSRRTFFRYFPSKEGAILFDTLDSLLADAILGAPKSISAIQAIRAASAHYASLPHERQRLEKARFSIIAAQPSLRARLINVTTHITAPLVALIAEREGKSPQSIEARTLANAVMGVAVGALVDVFQHDEGLEQYLSQLDEGLVCLEETMLSHYG
jgi:AcrR family transcriptional regulator